MTQVTGNDISFCLVLSSSRPQQGGVDNDKSLGSVRSNGVDLSNIKTINNNSGGLRSSKIKDIYRSMVSLFQRVGVMLKNAALVLNDISTPRVVVQQASMNTDELDVHYGGKNYGGFDDYPGFNMDSESNLNNQAIAYGGQYEEESYGEFSYCSPDSEINAPVCSDNVNQEVNQEVSQEVSQFEKEFKDLKEAVEGKNFLWRHRMISSSGNKDAATKFKRVLDRLKHDAEALKGKASTLRGQDVESIQKNIKGINLQISMLNALIGKTEILIGRRGEEPDEDSILENSFFSNGDDFSVLSDYSNKSESEQTGSTDSLSLSNIKSQLFDVGKDTHRIKGDGFCGHRSAIALGVLALRIEFEKSEDEDVHVSFDEPITLLSKSAQDSLDSLVSDNSKAILDDNGELPPDIENEIISTNWLGDYIDDGKIEKIFNAITSPTVNTDIQSPFLAFTTENGYVVTNPLGVSDKLGGDIPYENISDLEKSLSHTDIKENPLGVYRYDINGNEQDLSEEGALDKHFEITFDAKYTSLLTGTQ